MLDYQTACQFFECDAEAGHLQWRRRVGDTRSTRRWNTRYAGTMAGCAASGYLSVRLDGRSYPAHRIIWLLSTGNWPEKHIDHIDGDPTNNRWTNLRLCTHSENQQNVRLQRNNTTGVIGVSRHKASGLFTAEIKCNGQRHRLGYFHTIEAARDAYLAAKARLHSFQPTPRAA